jgi:asparagine synthase (glutamine-hydrolysing)
MCGIVGMLAHGVDEQVDLDVLAAMSGSLSHRGPDGGGSHVEGPLAMAMRRLSIIDVAGGHQPLTNEDGSLWVVFNGEIYNYRELTAELRGRGHRFATASDTETIVHLYEELGETCAERLRGMFAFALWDRRRRRLLLARDRLGIKPLYYATTARGFVFGSELKALMQCPWLTSGVDMRGVDGYLQFGYVADPLTILQGVSKLKPGHTLTVDERGRCTARRYWDPSSHFHANGDGTGHSEAEAVGELSMRLREAVKSHLVSDVPVGAFLSGGLDSSAVVAAMAAETGSAIKTFSVGFAEEGYNEAPYARRVAAWFGTEHHELIISRESVDLIEQILATFDEPFADASAIPTYAVSKLARQHVKVVLSGDGGDELFAGYDRYVVDHRRRYIGLVLAAGLGRVARQASRAIPEGGLGKNYLYNASLSRLERYVDAISIFPRRSLRELLDREPVPAGDFGQRSDGGMTTHDWLSRLQDIDLSTYLPGDILTKVDRMTMANSLEARVPLLDHLLVEFACSLPPSLKLRSGVTKYILKRALRGTVPDEVIDRPKQGFAVPLESWFGERAPGFFRERLLPSTGVLVSVGIKPARVEHLVDLFRRYRRGDHCRQLWSLLVLVRALERLRQPVAAACRMQTVVV